MRHAKDPKHAKMKGKRIDVNERKVVAFAVINGQVTADHAQFRESRYVQIAERHLGIKPFRKRADDPRASEVINMARTPKEKSRADRQARKHKNRDEPL